MAHFRGEMSGTRAETFLGSRKSGMLAHVHGWDFGVRVLIFYDPSTGKDTAVISLTGGSKDPSSRHSLGSFTLDT